MNKALWKLDRIGERLWIMATLTAAHAASLEKGKGLAVVAEETRRLGNRVNDAVEKVMVEGKELSKEAFITLAGQLNLLAFNCAIESSRMAGFAGKQAATYADEIRDLAGEIICLFDEASAARKKQTVSPWAANPSSAARNGEFLLLNAGGIHFVEPLVNVQEVYVASARGENSMKVRNTDFPLVDVYKMLGQKQESLAHVIVWTPWAEQNKAYAVTADVSFIFFSPIGKPIAVPADMPLAKYVRECWENENGEPFYFMDWTKMV